VTIFSSYNIVRDNTTSYRKSVLIMVYNFEWLKFFKIKMQISNIKSKIKGTESLKCNIVCCRTSIYEAINTILDFFSGISSLFLDVCYITEICLL